MTPSTRRPWTISMTPDKTSSSVTPVDRVSRHRQQSANQSENKRACTQFDGGTRVPSEHSREKSRQPLDAIDWPRHAKRSDENATKSFFS